MNKANVPHMSDSEVAEAIYRVVNLLSSKFRFGYHSVEDMKQQGALFACEALAKGGYDPQRPLENFLYTHVRNRFINYKRDNYLRNEPPCLSCIFYDPDRKKSDNQCAAFADKMECKKYADWYNRNSAKRSLMKPMDIDQCYDTTPARSHAEQEEGEAINHLEGLIDRCLAVDLRADYLRLKEGQVVPKLRKEKVRSAIKEILGRDSTEDMEDAE
jgi:hypothetical protein